MILSLRKVGLLALALCIFCGSTLAQQSTPVTLAWDPNPESDLKEYRLHIGIASRNYQVSIPVGLVTTFTVTDLPAGVTTYFALTAINHDGLESDYSEEVLFAPKPPGDGQLTFIQRATDFQVTLNGTPATTYTIQTSSNLRDWTVVTTQLSDPSGVISVSGTRWQQGRAQFFRAVKFP